MPYQKDATENKKDKEKQKEERREMEGDVLGPAVHHVALLCVSSHSWLQQRREVRMYLLAWHKHCSGQKDLRASLWGDVALAAAGGGADWAAHAPFGGGLGLWLRIWFWLQRVIVGGHGFGLSIPVCADIIAPGLWLTLLLTLLQSETDEGTDVEKHNLTVTTMSTLTLTFNTL